VRNIYTDEAGTSAPEPVSVVAALVVNQDLHWFPVIRHGGDLGSVHPKQLSAPEQTRVAFHAKHVSDGTKYPGWAEESRRSLLRSMMAIPGEFEIPVSFAAVKRGAFDWSGWPEKHKRQMTPAKSDHMSAFTACIGTANNFIKSEYKDELAQIIADDNGEMREILRTALNDLQGRPFPVDVQESVGDNRELKTRTEILRADRIIDEVCFLTPRNAPFLQLLRHPRIGAQDRKSLKAFNSFMVDS